MKTLVFFNERQDETSGLSYDIKLGKQTLDLNKVTKRGLDSGHLDFINFYQIHLEESQNTGNVKEQNQKHLMILGKVKERI